MMEGGGSQSHRISDGQFIYSQFCAGKKREQDRIELEARKERIEKCQAARYNGNTNASLGRVSTHSTTETTEREELFSGSAMGRAVKNFFMDGGSETTDAGGEKSVRVRRSEEKSAQDQLRGAAVQSAQSLQKIRARQDHM